MAIEQDSSIVPLSTRQFCNASHVRENTMDKVTYRFLECVAFVPDISLGVCLYT